jgi:hypothetical protein
MSAHCPAWTTHVLEITLADSGPMGALERGRALPR